MSSTITTYDKANARNTNGGRINADKINAGNNNPRSNTNGGKSTSAALRRPYLGLTSSSLANLALSIVEFQNYKFLSDEKWSYRVGGTAIIDTDGRTVLDAYAAYRGEDEMFKFLPGEKLQTSKPDFLFENGAVRAEDVEKWARSLFEDRIVVVHGGYQNLTSFYLEKDVFAKSTIADTQKLWRGHSN